MQDDPPLGQVYGSGPARSVSALSFFSRQGYRPRSSTRVKPLVCGEEAFKAVGNALKAARTSINMAFWGLDPAVLLERGTAENYEHEHILAEILLEKARAGVQVRIVVWDHYWVGIGSGGSGQSDLLHKDTGGNNTNLAKFYDLAKITENLEVRMTNALSNTQTLPSFHQKIITIDVETPATATAFVMGHNMLVPYWSTKALLPHQPRREFALRITGENNAGRESIPNLQRTMERIEDHNEWLQDEIKSDPRELEFQLGENQKEADDIQRRIDRTTHDYMAGHRVNFLNYSVVEARHLEPYLDISTQIWGGGVVDVYHNFERVWRLNGGKITPSSSSLSPSEFGGGDTNVNTQAQLGATFTLLGETAIDDFYTKGISQANKYVLMVNQYFRDKDHADKVISLLKQRGVPEKKKIHIYVVTNDFDGTKEQGHDGDLLEKFADAGIPISLCKMVTREATGRKSIYVHAKLLLVDDVFFSIGSANYNKRSLRGDPEFNVAVHDPGQSLELRREVMRILIGRSFDEIINDPEKAINKWADEVTDNTTKYERNLDLRSGRVIQYDPSTWNWLRNHLVQIEGATGDKVPT